jgi:hypothetical protein
MVKKIVIAGNYSQDLNYLRETGENPSEARYVCTQGHVAGLPDDIEIVRYGTSWQNPVDQSSYIRWIEAIQSKKKTGGQ